MRKTIVAAMACAVALVLLSNRRVARAQGGGAWTFVAPILGQTSRPFSLCLASETIAIPMAAPASLSRERLAFAITTLAGTTVTLASGAGMYLEATHFTGAP